MFQFYFRAILGDMIFINGGPETRRCEFESHSKQRLFRCSLQCQINMNLVFHISEVGSEIVLKHCASSKTSATSSRKYFVQLNWIGLATKSVDSIAQLVERRSRNPKMRAQISLERVFRSLSSAVSD